MAPRNTSSWVSSTRQTDSGRTSLAAAANFCALCFAASPRISIRSGISRATVNALSPMDPVAPRITTRLRFTSLNDSSYLCDVDHETHVEKQERRREEQTIQKIERATDSWKQIARVFYVGAALYNGFGQIAEDCGKPQQQPQHCRVCPVEHRQMPRHEFVKRQTAKRRKDNSAEKTFPGFLRADVRHHQMPPHRAARPIRTHGREFG